MRESFATTEQLKAQLAARDADVERAKALLASAQSDLAKSKIDLDRRQALSASGAVSGEELTSAKNAYQTALANVAATKASGAQYIANRGAAVAQLAAQAALTTGTTAENNPEAQAAKAALDAAKLDQSRTVIVAPIDGGDRQARGAGRPTGGRRRHADDRGAVGRALCGRQLQGSAAA